MSDLHEPAIVAEARRTIEAWEKRAGHDAYAQPLDGGYKGYQAMCWDCDWHGTQHLRGDEVLGSEESYAHKRRARLEAVEHRRETVRPFLVREFGDRAGGER